MENPLAQEQSRQTISVIALIVASVLSFLAVFAIWLDRQLLDTKNWTKTSSELLEQKVIRQQVSSFLVDRLYQSVNVQAQLQRALPPRLDPLAGPAAGGLNQLAQRVTTDLLGRPQVQNLWEQANKVAHQMFLNILDGGGRTVSTRGGKVVLNLNALIVEAQQTFGVGGNIEKKLPPDKTQIVLLRSNQLKSIQVLVTVLRNLAVFLPLLAFALFAWSVYLSSRRYRTLQSCGIGLGIVGFAILAARKVGGNIVENAVSPAASAEPAFDEVWRIATTLLTQSAIALIIYSVIIVGVGWLLAPRPIVMNIRRRLAPYLASPRLAFGSLSVIILLLIIWSPTPTVGSLIPLLILTALLFLAVEAVRRKSIVENPQVLQRLDE